MEYSNYETLQSRPFISTFSEWLDFDNRTFFLVGRICSRIPVEVVCNDRDSLELSTPKSQSLVSD